MASNFVLGRLSGPGRLTDSAARTNLALLIRRAVRPCNLDHVGLSRSALCGLATGKDASWRIRGGRV